VFRSTAGLLAAPVFPSDCLVCQSPLDDVSAVPVCSACVANIHPQIEKNLCSRCATRLDLDSFASAQDSLCDECRESPPKFEKVLAYGEYSGELRELIHLLKFSGIYPIASLLAGWMAQTLLAHADELPRPLLPQPLLITAVPLFSRKQSDRGFNQARLLAIELSKNLRCAGWNVRENYQVLHRKRATRSQSELNLRQRRANMRGVFGPGASIEQAQDANILLVDDIVTTGATARQCASVLKRSGAAQVWVVTAARSQREDTARWGTTQ
jgi:ComF family protein